MSSGLIPSDPGLLLSIVVCTFNRSKLLIKCLNSLVNQSASTDSFEVIVIDNNSTDETSTISSGYVSRHKNFKYFKEDMLGLSHARNRGWQEAKGAYVAYIDDDAVAFPDWVDNSIDFIWNNQSTVAFGGPYEAITDTPLPSWFPPEYGHFNLGDSIISLDAQTQFLCGTNMVFRRELLQEIGGFSSGLGMSGGKLSYGEETRLQIELKRQGHTIYYVPSIRVKHLLASEKMRLRWLMKSVYSVGKCSPETFGVERSIFSCLCGLCYGGFYALRFLIEKPAMPLKRKLYYSLIPLVSEFGVLTGLLRRMQQ